ncbi:MAG: Gfo/Idh/MocA family oxidoreductase [Treponemataceae bacterium]
MSFDNPIRVGFVGSGFAARFHYESLKRLPGSSVRMVGVYSPKAEHRLEFARERGLEAFETLDALLDVVDVVHVVVPAAAHESVLIRALQRGVVPIVEKPFTGYFGPPDDPSFRGNEFSKEKMLEGALASAARIRAAEAESGLRICYAENWIFTPAIQKEIEIIQKTKAQILWMIGEEAHSGSHSPHYGIWRESGGGSLMGKGTHPLTTVLYLKRVEGLARLGRPIRPKSVSARVHELIRLPAYEDKGFLRTDYTDVEDWGSIHLTFDDGMIADVFSSEVVMGGVHNWLEVLANNHRTRCNINPIDGLETYNPVDAQFKDVYVVEKIGTKQGWSKPAMNEDWMNGYVQEMEYFYDIIARDEAPLASSELGFDTVSALYSAYLSAERHGAEVLIPT